jgi:hypothetical protein
MGKVLINTLIVAVLLNVTGCIKIDANKLKKPKIDFIWKLS